MYLVHKTLAFQVWERWLGDKVTPSVFLRGWFLDLNPCLVTFGGKHLPSLQGLTSKRSFLVHKQNSQFCEIWDTWLMRTLITNLFWRGWFSNLNPLPIGFGRRHLPSDLGPIKLFTKEYCNCTHLSCMLNKWQPLSSWVVLLISSPPPRPLSLSNDLFVLEISYQIYFEFEEYPNALQIALFLGVCVYHVLVGGQLCGFSCAEGVGLVCNVSSNLLECWLNYIIELIYIIFFCRLLRCSLIYIKDEW